MKISLSNSRFPPLFIVSLFISSDFFIFVTFLIFSALLSMSLDNVPSQQTPQKIYFISALGTVQ